MTTAASRHAPDPIPAPGPGLPSDTFYFRSSGGQRLYGELFAPPDESAAAAVVLHGYQEHCGRYREVANVLQEAGMAVMTYDMRGHGRSDGQRGFVGSFDDYLDDLSAAIAELDSHIGERPLALVGHSNGGLVTLRTMADPWRRPKRVTAAVLSSPFLGLKLPVSPVKALTARFASLALPTLSLPNPLNAEELTSDLVRQEERRVDTLCHDVASARWFTEAGQTQRWVLEFAHRIEVPTLWLVAGSDAIADPRAARRVADRIQAPLEYHEFPAMQHEVFNEVERSRAFALLGDFLTRHLPSAS